MSVRLVLVPRWPYIALIDRSVHQDAAKRAVERFERAEKRLNGSRAERLDQIERKASDIVRLADELLEEEPHEQSGRRGSKPEV